MNMPVLHERRKQPIRRSVTSALELFLHDLNGHPVVSVAVPCAGNSGSTISNNFPTRRQSGHGHQANRVES